MIKANIKDKNTLVTEVTDHTGKTMTICSSKVESPYFSPRQLVQAALAGCFTMTLRRKLTDYEIVFRNVEVSVDMKEENGDTVFTYAVSVDSDADQVVIDALKKKAAAECYISGLLSKGIKIVEGNSNCEKAAEQDRCCD